MCWWRVRTGWKTRRQTRRVTGSGWFSFSRSLTLLSYVRSLQSKSSFFVLPLSLPRFIFIRRGPFYTSTDIIYFIIPYTIVNNLGIPLIRTNDIIKRMKRHINFKKYCFSPFFHSRFIYICKILFQTFLYENTRFDLLDDFITEVFTLGLSSTSSTFRYYSLLEPFIYSRRFTRNREFFIDL